MACMLAFSLGGLAFVAGPMNNRSNAQWDDSSVGSEKPRPEATELAPPAPVAEKTQSRESLPETLAPFGPTSAEQATGLIIPVTSPPAVALPLAVQEELTDPETLPAPRVVDDATVFAADVRHTPAIGIVPPVVEPIETQPVVPAPRLDESILVEPTVGQGISVVIVPAVAPVSPPTNSAPESQPDSTSRPQPNSPLARVEQPVQQPTPPATLPNVGAAPATPHQAVSEPVTGSGSAPSTTVQPACATNGACKLKMLMRLGDGKPRFEIRNTESTELLFKVYADKVEMQSAPEGMQCSPIAGVTAVGQVRFVGPGIEGTCDQLSVLSGTGEVLLKGNVQMKTKHGKAWNEVTGEKMIYQIGAHGLSTSSIGSSVRPASYNTR
jgi:hypothetical protein